MILQHLPALMVVLPLLAAPLCVVLPNNRMPWLLALLVTWSLLALSLLQLAEVGKHGVLSYAMGGWQPPWGIEYRVDNVNAFVVLIITAIGAVVMPYARDSVVDEVERRNHAGFYGAYLLALTGLLGISMTGDVFNLFVFLEISSLASYSLVSQGRDRRALLAAYQYLVIGTVGATFLLIGIGLLYGMTGTLNMADLAERLPAVAETRAVYAAFAFIAIGVATKLALFPLHLWLPNAYTHAPSMVSAFLAATATKVAVYVLLRFMYTVFGWEYVSAATPFTSILMVLAVAAILVGSLAAIMQDNAKRLLAYSSVAQIGYMVLGISMATVTGLTAGILHLFNHALMKGALFLALGCIVYRLHTMAVSELRGLGRRMPLTMAAFVVGGLSLIGVPLTVGFISKWYLILAAIELQWWSIVAVILIGSVLALVYIGRVVEIAYFREPDNAERCEAPWSLLLPTWLLVLANLYFGIDTRLTVGLATDAASMLMGVSP